MGDSVMKKACLSFLLIISRVIVLYGQDHHRQDFLSALSKLPDIKTCEAAYSFIACKNHSCDVYTATRADLMKAHKELVALQLANQGAITGTTSAAMMNPEEAKKLQEKLKKMTPEEKQQWAMQNAQNMMANANVHANKDMNNQQVTEAVRIVTEQEERDTKDISSQMEKNITSPTYYSSRFTAIEAKFKPQKDEAIKKYQTVTHSTDDPSTGRTGLGEASKEEIARYDKAFESFKKTVVPIYNSEMNEKLTCVLQTNQILIQKYKPTEEQIALTHYVDDAKESSNREHLITGHSGVLQRVTWNMDSYQDVLFQYANQYARLMGLEPVKELKIDTN
jgi:hypothetical protein